MPSIYTNRVYMFVPAAAQAQVNALALQISHRPADAQTYVTGLNASGLPTDPVAYYFAAPALTDHQWTTVLSLVPQVTGAIYYCCDNAGGTLISTNSTTASGSVGQPWTMAQALTDMGLQMIAPQNV